MSIPTDHHQAILLSTFICLFVCLFTDFQYLCIIPDVQVHCTTYGVVEPLGVHMYLSRYLCVLQTLEPCIPWAVCIGKQWMADSGHLACGHHLGSELNPGPLDGRSTWVPSASRQSKCRDVPALASLEPHVFFFLLSSSSLRSFFVFSLISETNKKKIQVPPFGLSIVSCLVLLTHFHQSFKSYERHQGNLVLGSCCC